ncbi:MAG: hypothetical protein F4Y47_04235 [Acidobacteriia bacterium]|nr:hypothetical protein [Terriglobia bacterium]MYG04672.1 hypothetical protein [Terriglobia bacterium]MYK09707.1 hypothetical protein [Terriglobia bacterium]
MLLARSIAWTRQARPDLRKLSRRDSDRVQRAIARLAVSGEGDIERLRGFASSQYRLRVGDWRVRYRYDDVDTDEEGISVTRVLHRREAYRKSALARQDIPDVDGFDETAAREGPD